MSETPSPQRCFICDFDNPNGLEEHHIVPRRYSGTDEPENIVQLCASCHAAIEKLYDDEFYKRLGVDKEEQTVKIDLDYQGENIEPEESKDRKLTGGSDHPTGNKHIRVERFIISFSLIEFWNHSAEELASQHPKYEEYIKNELLDHQEEIADAFKPPNGRDWLYIPSENKRKSPDIAIIGKRDDFQKYTTTHGLERLHCGYCHTVFSEDEHANLARHLRLKHGIEDPYDEIDTDDDLLLTDRFQK